MGIRAERGLAEHILKENVHNSNLISDISLVDYTKNHLGETHLQEKDGFPIFVDDLYVFGYLRQTDIVYNRKGGICCTTGPNGAATYIIEQVRAIVKYTIGKDNASNLHTNFMHTIALGRNNGGVIESTIRKIENNSEVKTKWEEYNNGEEAVGAFVLKIDVSNVPLKTLKNNLQDLRTRLLGIGNDIYCVDYTQDYSGTMDRDKLIEHLTKNFDFRMQGEYNDKEEFTILDNVESVGRNVLTYIYENKYTKDLLRVKFYNKIVSNFEAGEVRSSLGGHLADYVYSSNERLRKLFSSKDVQERGITRLEVSIYGTHRNISGEIGNEIIQRALEFVTPQNSPLFVIQPAKEQWNNLEEKITKCLTLVDRPHTTIYLIWYGNSTTNRLVGIKNDYSKKKDLENIEDYVKWEISDFGFRLCPIYRTDILKIKDQNIILSPLQCYIKNQDSYTILAPCNRPLTVYNRNNEKTKNLPDISFYLPPSYFVSWEWRYKKERPSNERKPKQELIEMPELTLNKNISMLSVKQRAQIEEELLEAKLKVEWVDKSKDILKTLEIEIPTTSIEDMEKIKEKIDVLETRRKINQKIREEVEECLKKDITLHIKELDRVCYRILGWLQRNYKTDEISILEGVLENIENNEKLKVKPNTKLTELCAIFAPYFICNKSTPTRTIHSINQITNYNEENYFCRIRLHESRTFYLENRGYITYVPIEVDKRAIYKDLKEKIEKLEKEELENLQQHSTIFLEVVEIPKDKEKYICRDIEEGSYKIQRVSKAQFRGKDKIYLHLVLFQEDKIQGQEKIVTGYYIEEEWTKIENIKNIKHPVICRLGKLKTNVNKRKFRTCTIVYNKN